MSDWIGGIGDRRVICTTTMKIYSSPEGASYALNFDNPNNRETSVRVEDIVTCCNRFVKTIFNGSSFEWYNQYLKDNNLKDFQEKPEILLVDKPKTSRDITVKNRMGAKRFYQDVRKVYRAVKKTYLVNPSIIGFTFAIPTFLEKIGLERESSASMSKHFKTHIDVYKHLFDIVLSTTVSPKTGREVLSIKLRKFTSIGISDNIDGDFDILRYFSKHHDPESAYMKGKRKVSTPVIRLEDNRIFGSLHTAERLCGIERAKIVFCCEGDIPYCKKWGSKNTFRYIKFNEE